MDEPNYQDDLVPFADLPVVYGRSGKLALDQGEDEAVIIYCEDDDGLINKVELDPTQFQEFYDLLGTYRPQE